jgi:cysteinyl-tRNA synthetase
MTHSSSLTLHNSLSRKAEAFAPLNPPFVGLYVCGPTVYGDAHLGHARPAVTFDVLFRYLKHLGYQVRYVRNITDVGHLENDADEGEDKIAKKARVAQLEPMEIAQYYADRYRMDMHRLNTLRPSIEPLATGHIIEQIETVRQIMEAGFAYQSNGSVYFDVPAYSRYANYGELSGRNIEDLKAQTRELAGQSEKRNPLDFALWKKASPQHIMRWSSPWGEGFPGWHIECTAMSTKYLGDRFDIHGGGMDLLFPHHECEIAQSKAARKQGPARYWLHNNMVTVEGQKMGKSLGNFITLEQLFSGEHPLLSRGYSPMTIRFFMLQAHYRSTVDFSDEALSAADKGLERLQQATRLLPTLEPSDYTDVAVSEWIEEGYHHMNDDLNTPKLMAQLFEGVRTIHRLRDGQAHMSEKDLPRFQEAFRAFCEDILGISSLQEDASHTSSEHEAMKGAMELLLELRQQARQRKDFATADYIRDKLRERGIEIKDTRHSSTWELS